MRHKNLFPIIFSLILSLDVLAQCVGNVNNRYNFTFQSSAYKLVKENQTWSFARNCAISGGLAIIDSQTEQDTILDESNTLNLPSCSKGIYYPYIYGYSKPIKIVKL